ncbi:SDR family oxidoreductase [Rhizobium sp. XQZ8]|uniref:SDR family oxidoreductase n=1 Tax=Rhizobium populisoli TaxID=2859785 RepID=UPI001C66C520|nr:SDR family oxidoreductase [Rhizobium populisoli]MBW6424903.1 SDR family oxidoreductase [Rhizobium populisoli]
MQITREAAISTIPTKKPVVVITGASAGVGRAVALQFARHGWRVALMARGKHRLEAVASEVRAAGAESLVLPADVADAECVEAAASTVVNRWGKIDVWINNAMVTVFGPAESIAPDEFRRVTEVTYLGQVHGTQTALKHMRQVGGGRIVCIGSALTYRSIPLQSAYCGAKAAIRGFVDALRCELLHEGSPIMITMIHLPAVNTEQFSWARCKMDREPRPVAPVFTPEAVADEIYRGALSAPRELWVGRPTVKAILAGLILPGLTDRLAARTAFEGQLDGKLKQSRRPDNLFDAVDPSAVSGGRFGDEASPAVGSVSGSKARAALAVGIGTMMLAAVLASRRLRIR